MKTKIVLALLSLLLLAGWAWSVRYQYEHLKSGAFVRINRFTGQSCSWAQIPNPAYEKEINSKEYREIYAKWQAVKDKCERDNLTNLLDQISCNASNTPPTVSTPPTIWGWENCQ